MLLMLHILFGTRVGHFIDIPTSRVSVFKLGWVFVLFPRLTQWRLAKSVAIIVYIFDSAQSPALGGRPPRGNNITRQPLTCEDARTSHNSDPDWRSVSLRTLGM